MLTIKMFFLWSYDFFSGCFANGFCQTLAGNRVTSGQQPIAYCLTGHFRQETMKRNADKG
jgi:hypothetical protein